MGSIGRILVAAIEDAGLEKVAIFGIGKPKAPTFADLSRKYGGYLSPSAWAYRGATKPIGNVYSGAKGAGVGKLFTKGLTGMFGFMAASEFATAMKHAGQEGAQARKLWGV